MIQMSTRSLEIGKLLNLLFPFFNFNLPQPNVLKLIHNAYGHKTVKITRILHLYVKVYSFFSQAGASVVNSHILHLFQ